MSRWDMAGMRSLKRVKIAVCGLTNIDIIKESFKSFSYNAVIQNESILSTTISKMQTVLGSCKMQRVALERKVIILESVALSKIVSLSFLTIVPRNTRIDFQNASLKIMTPSKK